MTLQLTTVIFVFAASVPNHGPGHVVARGLGFEQPAADDGRSAFSQYFAACSELQRGRRVLEPGPLAQGSPTVVRRWARQGWTFRR